MYGAACSSSQEKVTLEERRSLCPLLTGLLLCVLYSLKAELDAGVGVSVAYVGRTLRRKKEAGWHQEGAKQGCGPRQSLIPDTQGALEHKWYHRVGPTLRRRCRPCTLVSVCYWLWTDSGEGLSYGVGVAAVLLKAILWRSGGAVSQYSQQLEGGVEEEAPAWQRVSEQGPVAWTTSSQLCSVCTELPLLTSLINMYFYLLPHSLLPSFLFFFLHKCKLLLCKNQWDIWDKYKTWFPLEGSSCLIGMTYPTIEGKVWRYFCMHAC